MKYSENRYYLEYMKSYASANYPAAKQSLEKCLEDCKKDTPRNSGQEADLLRRLGDIYFLEGNKQEALKQYQASSEIDPDSLLTKFLTAKFWGEKIGDMITAHKICDDIIEFAKAHPREESSNDFSSDDYIKKAESLKKSLV